MAACSRIPRFLSKSRASLSKSSIPRFYCSNTSISPETAKSEVFVPFRVQRGPADILKALASTISKDYTAPHYKYEDDPYFIPSSNVSKRAFALSKESGRKSARFFLETYPELFKCNTAEPHIKHFDPPIVYTENDDVSEATLKDCIQSSDVSNAMNIYEILIKKDVILDKDTKQDLLELLCFYNCEQPPSEEFYEERYFSQVDRQQPRNSWKGNGLAEKLFESMQKDERAYGAIISGAAKFQAIDRALTLFDEMRSQNLCGTTSIYNGLLLILPYIKEAFDTRWEYATELLNNMNSDGLEPDLYTMNALLQCLSRSGQRDKSRHIALHILAEMKRLQIEPSLGTYNFVLSLFCSSKSVNMNNASVLYEIMDEIDGQDIQLRHPSDVSFFSSAMAVCFKIVHDKELAYRIHNLLEFKNNSKLLGPAKAESLYFRYFFMLLCNLEDLDKFMEIYDKYVPNTYTPEPNVMLHIIEAIHFNGFYHHLPRICSDVILFEQTERENILSELMEAIGHVKHDPKYENVLVEMVWKIVETLDNRAQRRQVIQWTGDLLGNILKTFLNGKDLTKAWSIMQKLQDEEMSIIGHPAKDILLNFCSVFHELKDSEKVAFCVNYAVNGSYPEFEADLNGIIGSVDENGKPDANHGIPKEHEQ